MRAHALSALFILALALPAAARESAKAIDATEFNAAWQAFTEARQAGDSTAQVALAKRALDVGMRLFDESDGRVPALMTNYGMMLVENGDFVAARKILIDALYRATDIYGKESERLIPYLERLAKVHAGLYEDGRQRKSLGRAVSISAERLGKDSVEHGDLLHRAGVSLVDSGQADKGLRYLEDAAEIFASNPAAGPERTALTTFWLGKAEAALRHRRSATEYMLQALERMEALDEPMTEYELVAHAQLVELYEERNMSDAATEHCLAIGARRPDRTDADLQPVFRVAPRYPRSMLAESLEGYVDFRFTVDERGFVHDPVVVDQKGGFAFEGAAREAVERFRYAPRFVDGEPVAVSDVKTRITFRIEY